VFKRLFPPDLFAAFIDVGHYTANLNAYAQLVARFDGGWPVLTVARIDGGQVGW